MMTQNFQGNGKQVAWAQGKEVGRSSMEMNQLRTYADREQATRTNEQQTRNKPKTQTIQYTISQDQPKMIDNMFDKELSNHVNGAASRDPQPKAGSETEVPLVQNNQDNFVHRELISITPDLEAAQLQNLNESLRAAM